MHNRRAYWIVKAIIFAPVSIAANLLAMVLAPILPLWRVSAPTHYSKTPVPHLPGWLGLFSTQDNSLDEGYMGRESGHVYWPCDTKNKLAVYWSMVRWIWRNPGYGFNHYVLGAVVSKYAILKQASGDRAFYTCNQTQCFFFTNIYWLNRAGLRVKFGWKLWRVQNERDYTEPAVDGRRVMYSCSISLAKKPSEA